MRHRQPLSSEKTKNDMMGEEQMDLVVGVDFGMTCTGKTTPWAQPSLALFFPSRKLRPAVHLDATNMNKCDLTRWIASTADSITFIQESLTQIYQLAPILSDGSRNGLEGLTQTRTKSRRSLCMSTPAMQPRTGPHRPHGASSPTLQQSRTRPIKTGSKLI